MRWGKTDPNNWTSGEWRVTRMMLRNPRQIVYLVKHRGLRVSLARWGSLADAKAEAERLAGSSVLLSGSL